MAEIWKMMSCVEQAARSAGATIFGGFVRDKIIHDHFASEFYKTGSSLSKYNDPLFMPETFSKRTIIPKDIDMFMPSDKIPVFKQNLENLLLTMKTKSIVNNQFYFNFKHTKAEVIFAVNPIIKHLIDNKKLVVNIDIIHSDNMQADDLDFECNGLWITPDNEFKLCPSLQANKSPRDKLQKLNDIIGDILNNRAMIVSEHTMSYRIKRMIQKGWIVFGDTVRSVLQKTVDPESVCLICLDEFTNKIEINLNCCNAKMHKCCATTFIHKGAHSCPHCRNPLFFDNVDALILDL